MSKFAKHLRDCPAAARPITSRECGEGRQTQFACPATCEYNPFSPENYDAFGEIELRFIHKSTEYFVKENHNNATLARACQQAFAQGETPGSAFCMWHFFWLRDAQGQTMADRWEKRRFEGLSDDERVVLQGQRRARPALLEIRRVIDALLFECVDLLSGERLVMADRSIAASVVRFDALFAWVAPQPHFFRPLGHAVGVPEAATIEPREILLAIAQHLGAPPEAGALEPWLAEHWWRVSQALTETGRALRHTTLAGVDAKFYKAEYLFNGNRKHFAQRLAKNPDLQPETLADEELDAGFTEAFVWMQPALQADPAQPEFPGAANPALTGLGIPLLGRVLLGKDKVRIEASSTGRYAQLRPAFERLAAGLVEFRAEKCEDLGAQMAARIPYDAALVPPQLLQHAQRFSVGATRMDERLEGSQEEIRDELLQRNRQSWIDQPIPALENHTPRQAAAISHLRPTLLGMVKGIVHRADRESAAASEDATQLIATLGLEEIAEPTPPWRAASVGADDSDDWDLPIDEEPPTTPIDEKELISRVDAFIRTYPQRDSSKLDAAFEKFAGDLILAFEEFAVPFLDEHEQDYLYTVLVRLYFILVPDEISRTDVYPDLFEARLKPWAIRFTAALIESSNRPEAIFEPFEQSRQPLVALDLANVLLSIEGGKRRDRIRVENMPIILSFIAAAIDELDCAISAMR